MLKARRLALGTGDCSALISVSDDASVTRAENGSGDSSFVVSVARGVGSCLIWWSRVVRGGSSCGSSGGVLASIRHAVVSSAAARNHI
jgi:hypothetical protein